MIIIGRTSTYLPQVLDSDGDVASPRAAARLWGTGVASAVARLRQHADRVVVLRDTPHAPFDIPGCISWDPSSSSTCDFTRSRNSDDAEYLGRARGPACRRFVYSDPTSAVCPHTVCSAEVGGVITYRDDNHLTAAFASARWRQFAQALDLSKNLRPI